MKGKLPKGSKLASHIHGPEQKRTLFRRATMIACCSLAITIGSVYADNKMSDFETVYHIYIDGEMIGTVNDKDVVEEIIEQKIAEAKKTYDSYELSADDALEFIPEKVFNPQYNNNKAIEQLSSKLSVAADATAIVVDGKAVAYVKTKKDAEKAIESLKLQYVPEDLLAEVDENKEKKDDPLKNGESIILDVRLSEKVSFESKKAKPDDILSVKEAVSLLNKGTLTPKKHEIEEGDVLGSIANQYDLKLDQLLSLNNDLAEDTVLQIGDTVNVQAYEPVTDVIMEKKARKEIKVDYEIEVIETDDMYKGDTKVKQEGQKGKKSIEYLLVKENGQVIDKEILEEDVTQEPVAKVVYKGTKVIPSRGTGSFIWPTYGGSITSVMGYRWGRIHKGLDIAGVSNRGIKAADNGTVEFAAYDGTYGNKVIINHNNGTKTLYAHMSEIKVSVGQTVPKGTVIGIMGSTGNSTGVHLHFEVIKNGKNIDPQTYY
ncbi:peptidase M23 [Bacillus solimangrovi]|uniref:Peptidase M23 n=2 Tax=Bacillus solimangrovi TaxID=1305675 RepID=A0A1E5LGA1_9BACI|nr:peptidase M23 [Bacillus solimangrovi]